MKSKSGLFWFNMKKVITVMGLVFVVTLFTGCAGSRERLNPSDSKSGVNSSNVVDGGNVNSPEESKSSLIMESRESSTKESDASQSNESRTSSEIESEAPASTENVPCSHDYTHEILRYTSCSQEGIARYTCTICGYSEDRKEDIEGGSYHNLKTEKIEPTCTEYGYTIYSCSDCSYSNRETDYSQRPSHQFVRKVIASATELSVGVIEDVCAVCGINQGAKYVNYFSDIEYKTKELAEADLAAMVLVGSLNLNSSGKTDLEKLCALKEWYYNNTRYDTTYSKHTAYNNLVEHTSVCQGYAEALCLVLPKCGIETYYCSSDKLNHAWNVVNIDGQWTYTDFVGGLNFNSEHLIIGSNAIGTANDVIIKSYNAGMSSGRYEEADFDQSLIVTNFRLFDFDAGEISVIVGPGYFKYKKGNTTWTHPYKN